MATQLKTDRSVAAVEVMSSSITARAFFPISSVGNCPALKGSQNIKSRASMNRISASRGKAS